MLTMIIVVIGMKNLKPGLSTTMSPGNRPSGSFDIHGQASPTSAIRRPMMMRIRCTVRMRLAVGSEASLYLANRQPLFLKCC